MLIAFKLCFTNVQAKHEVEFDGTYAAYSGSVIRCLRGWSRRKHNVFFLLLVGWD
jgi:hypothetical protein